MSCSYNVVSWRSHFRGDDIQPGTAPMSATPFGVRLEQSDYSYAVCAGSCLS